uniref:Uncharacterized protein n=1 Tax=Oryza punctata TaxID=4537 RepID=A0A0E0LTR3_ORYPU
MAMRGKLARSTLSHDWHRVYIIENMTCVRPPFRDCRRTNPKVIAVKGFPKNKYWCKHWRTGCENTLVELWRTTIGVETKGTKRRPNSGETSLCQNAKLLLIGVDIALLVFHLLPLLGLFKTSIAMLNLVRLVLGRVM